MPMHTELACAKCMHMHVHTYMSNQSVFPFPAPPFSVPYTHLECDVMVFELFGRGKKVAQALPVKKKERSSVWSICVGGGKNDSFEKRLLVNF